MATIVQREIRRRGFFGKLFLGLFWIFNVLMLVWLIAYWRTISGEIGTGSEAAQTGAAIGATIGTGMLVFFWVAGAVILGLFAILTRGSRTLIEETRE